RRADQANALPRVLVVKADRHRHVRARGEVERLIADPVHGRRDRQDVRGGQAGGAPQALVAVARGRVDDPDDPPARIGTHTIARSSQSVLTAPRRKSSCPRTLISSVRLVSTPSTSRSSSASISTSRAVSRSGPWAISLA